jgi:hypothetical protein
MPEPPTAPAKVPNISHDPAAATASPPAWSVDRHSHEILITEQEVLFSTAVAAGAWLARALGWS